ncbi:MAG: succinylglutamate desuccinylase/aspartoacylase family protein [Phaeodactylibacter sp.]|nr:succinylglutamate desuccinylase/aspartoacylase family protein [Phaeodactylibacter sp.]MCB0616367.1 succinylglutamate desuccinylase/aspartoacylase family protein [Phaeodactylibacter sp.]MCB9273212.1 succinylglutamate desuccinylase/aspartoacylase family protein [Lewinellaceae bacterium]
MLDGTISIEQIRHLDIGQAPKGTIKYFWLHIINNGIGEPVRVPIIIARGRHDGPIMGITAAIHGNELNGIPVIQRLFRELDPEHLHGTLVGVLVVNVPGLLLEQRKFNDGTDLNRIAPGNNHGSVSEVYIYRIIDRVLRQFDYLIDLHTASFGRVNSWYVRADMSIAETSRMARLQNPEIILHNPPNDGTFRGAASHLGIHAITLELRDPHIFQFDIIEDALVGIRNVMYDLNMLEGEIFCPISTITLCDRSYWIYTDEGGILDVMPKVREMVQKDNLIAEVRTIFGKLSKQYFAPEDGVIIGKSINPINQTGSRILHLGINPREISWINENGRAEHP